MKNTLRAQYNASPCLGCGERHDRCHGSCEDYLEYRKQIDEINRQKRNEAETISYVKEQTRKTKKHLHSKWKGGTRYDE